MNLTMTGRLTDCTLLSYRTPAKTVAHLLPEGLELVTRGPWAFWNVVACRVEAMRPRAMDLLPDAALKIPGVFPGAGVSYHLVAYRLLVQAMTDRADLRMGLYFLRSDADARVLGAVGNRTTDFRFHPATIQLETGDHAYALDVVSADRQGDATLRLAATPPGLAPGSCFPTMTDAQEFLKYRPYALAARGPAERRHLRIAEVQRDETAWAETPVTVAEARYAYFERLGQAEHVRLELATRVAPMDYVWKLGRREPLLGRQRRKTAAATKTDAEAARTA